MITPTNGIWGSRAALPQMRMLPACLTEMLPLVFREPGGIGLKRAWQCAPLQADSSFLVVCGPTT